jgi:hypothetical protein
LLKNIILSGKTGDTAINQSEEVAALNIKVATIVQDDEWYRTSQATDQLVQVSAGCLRDVTKSRWEAKRNAEHGEVLLFLIHILLFTNLRRYLLALVKQRRSMSTIKWPLSKWYQVPYFGECMGTISFAEEDGKFEVPNWSVSRSRCDAIPNAEFVIRESWLNILWAVHCGFWSSFKFGFVRKWFDFDWHV